MKTPPFITNLTLVALLGCNGQKSAPQPPQRDLYKALPAAISYPMESLTSGNSSLFGEAYVNDDDLDGKADCITFSTRTLWVAQGHSNYTELLNRNPKIKIMTPEILDVASAVLKAEQDLAFLLNQREYELQIKPEN